MRSVEDTIKFIRIVLNDHENYWSDKLSEMKKYRDAYQNKFWNQENSDAGMLRVETADAFAYIEGFIASLFSKAPAIEIGLDEAVKGDPELAKAVANRFLYNQRQAFENGSRMALIYPASYFKLSPRSSENILDRVSIKAIAPWEVIVDRDASCWDDQRYVGHVYYLTLPDARDRFGAKQFTAVRKQEYFKGASEKIIKEKTAELPEEYLYIQIVELYDLLHDQLYFWSPNYSNGEKMLDKDSIPVRTYDDRALPPIAPLYYSSIPDSPLEGMSTLARIYDQIYEKNILRTYMANAVRRDSRQYLYKSGSIDEEQLAKITAGVDGAMIGVDEDSLEGLIKEVPVTAISSNHDRYLAYIEQDINRGSILAPFTRGEATKATATEITALAQYTASEIGKMARDRDEAIENVAQIYIRILSFLADEGEKAVMTVNGTARVIKPEDLDSKFKISALDQGSTPLSDAVKKQNLIQLLPILTQLSVPMKKIKEEVIRQWELPESFLDEEEEAAPDAATKVGPNSIPQEGELVSSEQTLTSPQDLASTLIKRNIG